MEKYKEFIIVFALICLAVTYNNCSPAFENDRVNSQAPEANPIAPLHDEFPEVLSSFKNTYQCFRGKSQEIIQNNTFKILNRNIGLLTRRQYEYSVETIFGIKFYAENKLPDKYQDGSYNTSFGKEYASEAAIKAHIENAQGVVDKLKVEKLEVFQCSDSTPVCLDSFINKYGPLLFRRPLNNEEIIKIKDVAVTDQSTTEKALEQALFVMLISPSFTYHLHGLDKDFDPESMQNLNEFDFLSRLTFFIWGSGPDEYLFNKAKNNLVKKEIVEIINYMLDAPDKPKYLARELAYNWFGMGLLRDSEREFEYTNQGLNTNQVKFNFAEQVQHFINWMIEENRPVTDLVQSNVMYHNKRSAAAYGLNPDNFSGNAFEHSVSDEDNRAGGVLSHRGLWANKFSNNQTHVINRGSWVMNNFLCSEPIGPPSGELFEDLPKFDSIREQVNSLSKGNTACAFCHKKFDHYGKALEIFDSMGKLRSTYDQGESVIYSSNVEGTQISSLHDLGRFLASEKKEQINYCATKNILTLLMGKDFFDNNVELSNEDRLPTNQAGSCYSINFYSKYLSDNMDVGLRDLIIDIITKGMDPVSSLVKINN